MSRTLVPYQSGPNKVKVALSCVEKPCWEGVGKVLGRRANTPKVILPGKVREMLNISQARMGVLVALVLNAIEPNRPEPHAPFHRSTVWHWEHSTHKHQIMPTNVCEVYRHIIRETVRAASDGKYAAQVSNLRRWRVTLRRVA